uniref:Uncharacterized protein n=1 Tax=Romanomermis culicivorax TaxID=13658 RepID=A0A915JMT1_ROMCU
MEQQKAQREEHKAQREEQRLQTERPAGSSLNKFVELLALILQPNGIRLELDMATKWYHRKCI